MGEHTPGPWLIVNGPQGNVPTPTVSGADACVYAKDGEDHLVVASNCLRENDARLIAAAPDLLGMLERIVNAGGWYMSALELEPDENGEDLEAEARKVLAKARGESNG